MKSKSAVRILFLFAVSMILLSFSYVQTRPDIQQKNNDPWNIPDNADKLINPVKNIKSSVLDGKKIFLESCSPCHGTDGIGDGPASSSLNPPPKNLTAREIQKQSDGVIFSKISNGDGGAMEAWKNSFSEKQIWCLVTYIRELEHK